MIAPVLAGHREVREQVSLGREQGLGGLGKRRRQPFDDRAQLGVGRGGVGLSEDRPAERRDHGLGGLGHVGQDVPQDVHPTALPGRAEERRGDGLAQADVGVGGDEHDARQAAGHERTQERRPERAGFGRPDLAAQDLALAPLVDRDRHQERHGHDPAALADLLVPGVEPEIWITVLVEPALPKRP